MECREKTFIKYIACLSMFIILVIIGLSTDKQVSADNSSRILVSNVTSDLANSSETTTTTITAYLIDDQRDVKYFEIYNSGLIYKNEDELDANPIELIIPKTINGENVLRFGWTQTLHAGLTTSFSYGPFYNCSRLERLFIPDTVHDNVLDYEDSNPFKDCKYDGKYIDIYIYADDIQSFLEYSYGENFGLSYNALVNGKVVEELTIPDNITEVIDGAFFKCKSLKNVYIPEHVVSLGDNAFNSDNMESITIYNPNCELGEMSISNNGLGNYNGIIYGYTNSTAHVYAEENGYTFAALDQDNEVVCTSRTTETTTQIQTTQTTISKEGEVVVSLVETSQTTTSDTENTETVTTDIMTTSAVSNITTEKATLTETTTTTITTYLIDDQRDITYFDPDGGSAVYKNPDRLWADPVELIIPKTIDDVTVTSFGWTHTLHYGLESANTLFYYGPFYKCYNLERLFIPDSIQQNLYGNTSNDYNPFNDLKEYNTLSDIDIYIYSDDIHNFFEFSYGENFRIYYNALINGTILDELTIPDNVTEIIDNAFSRCKSLKNVYIPKHVVSLGDNAFNSKNLESITIYNPNCELGEMSISNNGLGNYNGIIYGYTNSTAHVYAEENGYTFAALDQDNEVVCTSRTTETTTQIQTTQTTISKEGEVVVSLVETSQTTTSDTENTETVTTDITTTSAVSNITTEKTTSTETTTTSTITTEPIKIAGDASGDNILNVRDCSYIASKLAQGKKEEIPENADFNNDKIINVRDAAAIARYLASK